jgi:hypothetical protein
MMQAVAARRIGYCSPGSIARRRTRAILLYSSDAFERVNNCTAFKTLIARLLD